MCQGAGQAWQLGPMIPRCRCSCESRFSYSVRRDRNVAQIDGADAPQQISARAASISEFIQMTGKWVVEGNAVKQAESAFLDGVEIKGCSHPKLSRQLVSAVVNVR